VAPDARRVRTRFVRLLPVVQGTLYAAAFFIAPASERVIYFQF
jgi:hypothetical protein